jgi:hypothetical protein
MNGSMSGRFAPAEVDVAENPRGIVPLGEKGGRNGLKSSNGLDIGEALHDLRSQVLILL